METLPDLDNGPEIFQTSDVESVELLPTSTEVAGTDLDTTAVDMTDAKEKFEKNMIQGDVDNIDFSGSVHNAAVEDNGYFVGKWTETSAQRLERIARELEEIKTEDKAEAAKVEALKQMMQTSIETRGKSGLYAQEITSHLLRIDQALEKVDIKENITPSAESGDGQKLHIDSWTLDIEKKLDTLEKVIGSRDIEHTKNLRAHLNDLDRKVSVLYEPEYELSKIKEEVKTLNQELESLAINRRRAQLAIPEFRGNLQEAAPETEQISKTKFERMVERVYDKIKVLEESECVLPATVARLRTLHKVHYDIASAVELAGNFSFTLSSLLEDLSAWNSNLDAVNQAIDVHVDQFSRDSRETEARLQEMENRLKSLGM